MRQWLLTAAASAARSKGRISMADTAGAKAPRPFSSAEKPGSLYPLSFKQAVVALLQVGPVDNAGAAKAASESEPQSTRSD